jgi:S-adenosylmethionine uptake transporter
MSSGNNLNLRGALLALAAMGLYATHDVVVKVLGRTYSPIQIVFFGALLSFPLVSFISLADRDGGRLWPRQPIWVMLRSACMVLTSVSAFYAFTVLPLAQTYAILFATPLLVTLMSIPFLGEHVGLHRLGATVLGLVGVLVVLRPGQEALSAGHLSALLSAVTGALASVIARRIGPTERPLVMLLFPMLGNVVVMGALLPLVYLPMPFADLGLSGIIAVLGLGAALMVILAFRAGEAVIVAPMQYSQILWATVYGYLLFDEPLDGATFAGASIIIASGIYIVLREALSNRSRTRPAMNTGARNETVTTPRLNPLARILGLPPRQDR